jgi:voltage-gated potassium channel
MEMNVGHNLANISTAFRKWRNNNRFLLLLASIVILLLLYPIFEENAVGQWTLISLTMLLLIVGVYAVADTRLKLAAALVLAVIPIVTGWLSLVSPLNDVALVYNSSTLLFFVFVTIMVLISVLKSAIIQRDTIYGGICVYLLIGLTYGMGFFLIDTILPGSFYPYPIDSINRMMTLSDHFYYSFYTLTTLGYGDVVPLTAAARTIAMFCVVSGVLYLAVLIAWLVGGLTTREESKQE